VVGDWLNFNRGDKKLKLNFANQRAWWTPLPPLRSSRTHCGFHKALLAQLARYRAPIAVLLVLVMLRNLGVNFLCVSATFLPALTSERYVLQIGVGGSKFATLSVSDAD
jgi:hypothetical protein